MIRAANEWHAPRFMYRCSNRTILHGPFGNQTSDFSNEPLDLDCDLAALGAETASRAVSFGGGFCGMVEAVQVVGELSERHGGGVAASLGLVAAVDDGC